MTHWRKLVNPDYLGSYALEPGQELTLTIDKVQLEEVHGPDGRKETLPVCHFRERDVKPLVLNRTNSKTIEKLAKTPYIESWAGIRIQLYSERVRAFGETVDALRVRPFPPKEAEVKCEACGGTISGAYGMNAVDLAAYTKRKYGRALCPACATKEAAAHA